MGKERYLGPKDRCDHCGKLFKKGKSITVDGASDLVFCYSVQVGDCLQQYLLFNQVKNGGIFSVTMIYKGGFGRTMPSRKVLWMEKIVGFLGGLTAR